MKHSHFLGPKAMGWAGSLLIHGAALFGGSAFWIGEAHYGVEQGIGGLEVDLVAALPASESSPIKEPMPFSEAGPPETKIEENVTTLHSVAGGSSSSHPAYLKNPAPRYPELARRRGEEGIVFLWAHVSASGAATRVEIKAGSGSALLDVAALKAVGRWKFQPARAGLFFVDSTVEIPIRFRLDEEET